MSANRRRHHRCCEHAIVRKNEHVSCWEVRLRKIWQLSVRELRSRRGCILFPRNRSDSSPLLIEVR